MVRELYVLLSIATIIPCGIFLWKFRAAKGFETVATDLRWLTTIPIAAVLATLFVNLNSLNEPLPTSTIETLLTIASRVFIAVGVWVHLMIWLRRRGTPVQHGRRKDDPKF